jgi:transposase
MILPYANKDSFAYFAKELKEQLHRDTLLIADKASFHQAACVDNTQLTLAHLPTACPELNSVEGFFKEIRKLLANRIFHSLEKVFTAVEEAVKQWQPQAQQLIGLTLFPYIQHTQLSF